MTQPYFSVIILYWNNQSTLPACLEALAAQTYRDFEVVLQDNGSAQPIAMDWLNQFPQLNIQFLAQQENIGFAGGNNYASKFAQGKYYALLNADAFPDPSWLETMYAATLEYPGCFFSSKLVQANQPDRMDGMGDVYHVSGLAWRQAYDTLVSAHRDEDKEVFSACGAAAVYPVEAYKRVSGFDESYLSYMEDVDLGFRLRLSGYRCIYLPKAVVLHQGSGSTSRRSNFSVYHGQRNMVWTYVKDMPGLLFWLLLPVHLAANLFMIALGISRRQGWLTIKAKWDALRGLRLMWGKRKIIQANRIVPLSKIIRVLDWNPVSPVIKLLR